MKSFLVIVSTLSFALSAFAFEGPVQADPNATPFETLQKLYAEANEPVTLDDFDSTVDTQSKQKCVFAGKTDSAPFAVNVNKYSFEEIIPGIPPSGPHFPGEPEKRKVISGLILYRWKSGSDGAVSGIWNEVVRQSTLSYESQEFVVNIPRIASYQDSPIEARSKKKGALVYLFAKAYAGSAQEVQVYGYCWRD